MKKGRKIAAAAAIAVLLSVVIMLLGAVPPFAYIYSLAEQNNMLFAYYGLTAGFTALCLLLFFQAKK